MYKYWHNHGNFPQFLAQKLFSLPWKIGAISENIFFYFKINTYFKYIAVLFVIGDCSNDCFVKNVMFTICL